MSACQVIKSNDRHCRNYARTGMTCCYPHRKLENTETVVETTGSGSDSDYDFIDDLLTRDDLEENTDLLFD